MSSVTVIFVGGPMDGQTEEQPYLPAEVVVHLREGWPPVEAPPHTLLVKPLEIRTGRYRRLQGVRRAHGPHSYYWQGED